MVRKPTHMFPYYEIALWMRGLPGSRETASLWTRIKWAIHTLRGKPLWADQVTLRPNMAKELAFFILSNVENSDTVQSSREAEDGTSG
jgi:hypothetical protein